MLWMRVVNVISDQATQVDDENFVLGGIETAKTVLVHHKFRRMCMISKYMFSSQVALDQKPKHHSICLFFLTSMKMFAATNKT